jgi:TonB family protein
MEPPFYPLIAMMAHESGKVILEVTINADGTVKDARIANKDPNSVKLLGGNSIHNIRKWTFAKPATAPYVETITYDYRLDTRESHVVFDLPDLVTIWGPGPVQTMTTTSKKH